MTSRSWNPRGFGRRPKEEDEILEEPQAKPPLEAAARILGGRSPIQEALQSMRALLSCGLSPQCEKLARGAEASLLVLVEELKSISAMVARGFRLANLVDCQACQLGLHSSCTHKNPQGTEPCECMKRKHK